MGCREHTTEQACNLFEHTKDLYGESKYREAIDILLHLLEYHCDCIAEWYIKKLLGLCYYYIDDNQKSIEYLESAKQLIVESEGDGEKLNRLMILDQLGAAYYEMENDHKSLENYQIAESLLHHYRQDGLFVELYLFHLRKGRTHLSLHQ
ncbi:MAG: tetratricopeptide repeat protein [FCB group bacterium]|nr:tetratricopeptide repeat protein [FCB group bacterium]